MSIVTHNMSEKPENTRIVMRSRASETLLKLIIRITMKNNKWNIICDVLNVTITMYRRMCRVVLPLLERCMEPEPDPGNSSRFDGGLCSGVPAFEPPLCAPNKYQLSTHDLTSSGIDLIPHEINTLFVQLVHLMCRLC